MKDNISTWIDSSHDHLNINNDEDFVFDDSAIALPTILNSPPDSVKSLSSNDDGDCTSNFLNSEETEKSYNFVNEEALIQPMPNSQDFLYQGPMAFQREIEMISCEQKFYQISGHNEDLVKSEDDMMIDVKTPIMGNDLMFSEHQMPTIAFKKEIKSEVNCQPEQDINMNTMPVHRAKLLARRSLIRPQIQLKIKMGPVVLQNGTNNVTVEEPVPNNTAAVISTPQLIDELLEKESDLVNKFDLVKYIDDDNVSKTMDYIVFIVIF